MRIRSRLLPVLLAGVWLGPATSAPAQTAAQAEFLSEALDATATGDWVGAKAFASRAQSLIAIDIVLWTRLRDGAGTWEEYGRFLVRHPDWPGCRRCAAPASGRCRRACRRSR